MSNLSLNLVATARDYPHRPALRCDELELTFSQFDAAAARVATFLERERIEPGDRVGLMLPNTPAFAVAFYGILRRGAVAVPMNPLLKAREIAFYLTNTGARALFATPAFAQEAAEGAAAAAAKCWLTDDDSLAKMTADLPDQQSPVERADTDTAVILHTSGTTGKPKGAELTHGGLNRNQEVTTRTLIEIGPDDVIMGCLPLFHVFGMTCALNAAVAVGALLTLIPRFDARKAIEVIARDRVTVFEGVPTMYSALLGVAAGRSPRCDAIAACLCLGRRCASRSKSSPISRRRSSATILEGYGLSETSPIGVASTIPIVDRKPGSIGNPIEGVEMRVVDPDGNEVPPGEAGEIQIRGHNVMKGYWNLPEATSVRHIRRRLVRHRRHRKG